MPRFWSCITFQHAYRKPRGKVKGHYQKSFHTRNIVWSGESDGDVKAMRGSFSWKQALRKEFGTKVPDDLSIKDIETQPIGLQKR